MIEFSFFDEIVSSPTTILTGKVTNVNKGFIKFVCPQSRIPPVSFEIVNGRFKAILHLSPGQPNRFHVEVFDKGELKYDGILRNQGDVVDFGSVTLTFNPLPKNKPVHLCVLLAADSTGSYDMPRYKLDRGEVANLDTAIRRLKVAGRLMQAYTQEEFREAGLGQRTFQFVDESVRHKGIFGSNVSSTPHLEVKVSVLRSPLKKSELRNHDYSQQNPNAKQNQFLFGHCLDLISKSDLITTYKKNRVPIQCAVMIMDSHWDQKYITAHAALGGGNDSIKLAIFGSHGLHSYPLTFQQVAGSFLDTTQLSTREVANDNGECGTSWQCLNVCLGAFLHEIGHLLGSPHQVDGVMLRDYVYLNRSFMTREPPVKKRNELLINSDGSFDKQCHWNMRDLIRYLYHSGFSIPSDFHDSRFQKVVDTHMYKVDGGYLPSIYITKPGSVVVKSVVGIYMYEFSADDLARYHVAFNPRVYGGSGPKHEINFDFDNCLEIMKQKWKNSTTTFDLRILSVAGELYIKDLKKVCYPPQEDIIKDDFNLGGGLVNGYKTKLLGTKGGDFRFIGFNMDRVYMLRIYHGSALDGISVYSRPEASSSQNPPPVPKRDYIKNIVNSKPEPNDADKVTFGSITSNYTDFHLEVGERIEKLVVRSGAWIDAVQIFTDRGRNSKMLGNSGGGRVSDIEMPTINHKMVGFYGYQSQWTLGFGVLYTVT